MTRLEYALTTGPMAESIITLGVIIAASMVIAELLMGER